MGDIGLVRGARGRPEAQQREGQRAGLVNDEGGAREGKERVRSGGRAGAGRREGG